MYTFEQMMEGLFQTGEIYRVADWVMETGSHQRLLDLHQETSIYCESLRKKLSMLEEQVEHSYEWTDSEQSAEFWRAVREEIEETQPLYEKECKEERLLWDVIALVYWPCDRCDGCCCECGATGESCIKCHGCGVDLTSPK